MSNKSEIPPAVAEYALEQLADSNGYSAHDMATAKASGFREAEAIAAGKIAKLSARLARYEDEDGNPKAQPNTLVSGADAPYMSDDTDPREAWADGYNAAVEERLCDTSEPHYTAHIDVCDLLKDAD